MNRKPKLRNRKRVDEAPVVTFADVMKQRLGWNPPTPPRPFRTQANVRCGACGVVKPGAYFDQPIMPPAKCRECSGGTHGR